MHLLNDSPVHISVQGSTQFQRLNWNHQLCLISRKMPHETSPICVHPVSQTSACETYHNITDIPFFLVSLVCSTRSYKAARNIINSLENAVGLLGSILELVSLLSFLKYAFILK